MKRRNPILRIILIALFLVPTWHLMGRDVIQLTARDSMGSPAFERARILPYPSETIDFVATAYCEVGITKSGVPVEDGIVAGDPHVLPLGSWIKVDSPLYSGIYQVMDTGRLVRGKKIDIWLPTYQKAINFGIRKVRVTILKYGPIRRPPVPFTL